ncbi:esterase [Sinomonas cellulolyticus]|uniref:Esterase n=1 Tax=Sinomonas cellulolyticus TaxID=2801916 RepID=A0ABS1K5B9_9MICC|nr:MULTISPECIES: alpha/beta hydrolase-fold protein [Sinomonas]MBL0706507.1 esterase [Sinomonas cellulolyticus]GHG44996.1 esterase [Sinomonas sp. KCTC 49339]
MDWLYGLRVVDGPLAVACLVLGVLGAAFLVWTVLSRRPRLRGALLFVGSLVLTAALTLAGHWLLVDILNVFPEDLPGEVLSWSGVGVAGVVLGAVGLVRLGLSRRAWGRRVAAVLSSLALVLVAAQQINAYFGLYLTVADLAGVSVSRIQQFGPELDRSAAGSVPLMAWEHPAGLPANGELRKVHLPNTNSGFAARDAYVYLPPAYFASTRPELPVLLLMAGQPGNPSDWLSGGQLRVTMDRFAAKHDGVAPVAVVVDPIGTPSSNTLCMDTRLGKAETYLIDDAVPWIKQHLTVAADARKWAAGGFSFGGTCAVQLLAKHPELFSSALGFAPEKEPSLAKERRKTIEVAFGGDEAAFEANIPEHFFRVGDHTGQFLFLAAGDRDTDFMAQADVVAAQAHAGGVEVQEQFVPGEGHSWDMISRSMPTGLDALAERWQLP